METNSISENYVEIKDQKIELEGITLLHLNEIRKWAHFLSILGFVAVGLLFFVGIIMIAASSILASFPYEQLGFLGPVMGILYFIIAGIYFIPVFYLFKFSQNAKHSLTQIGAGGSSNELMARAIDYLKKHFRFIGIMTIILLAVYLLVIIGLIIAFVVR